VPGITARACANIALVKYWGKRDAALNLPAAGSLSLSLAALVTETRVEFDPALGADLVELEGKPAGSAEAARVSRFLDLVRDRAAIAMRARVTSHNRFPTASGLASSASGFAALAVAATRAAGLELPPRDLSILARHGSGSAARSIFGGFVRMHAGDTDEASYAEPITSSLIDRVRMVIAIVGGGAPKLHTSRDAMDHTAATSPFYAAWLDQVPHDLAAAETALATRNLEALGEVTEHDALAMHASAIAARPPVIYWKPATLALLTAVRTLRQTGHAAWATMDAGPHVKVLTTVDDADHIARALANVEGVTATTISGPGGPAYVVG
jgi:diphosphomevalonate decarboxylase